MSSEPCALSFLNNEIAGLPSVSQHHGITGVNAGVFPLPLTIALAQEPLAILAWLVLSTWSPRISGWMKGARWGLGAWQGGRMQCTLSDSGSGGAS